MKPSLITKHVKLPVSSSLLAVLCCLSAQAGLYTFNFSDSGPIPQGGAAFSAEQAVTGIAHVITSIELILTFNDKASLTGDSAGIQGLLDLGTDASSKFVSFQPVVTSTASNGNRVYDVSFSGTPGTPGTGFAGSDPNNAWSLVLWDNSTSGIENGLVSWTMEISAVPEPTTVALICFGVLAGAIKLFRWRSGRRERTGA